MESKKAVICLLFIAASFLCIRAEKALGVDLPFAVNEPRIRIVDLTANRFSDEKVLVVSGYVENIGDQTIQGHVIIYLKNGVSVINALEAPVNNGAPLARGAKGYFELTTNIGSLPPMGTITVEFVSKQLPLR
jgi:hypothetical protein